MTIQAQIEQAVAKVDWPDSSGKFTIYPESGKKSGQGNGVTPIKKNLIAHLISEGWGDEHPLYIASDHNPGDLDVVTITEHGPLRSNGKRGTCRAATARSARWLCSS